MNEWELWVQSSNNRTHRSESGRRNCAHSSIPTLWQLETAKVERALGENTILWPSIPSTYTTFMLDGSMSPDYPLQGSISKRVACLQLLLDGNWSVTVVNRMLGWISWGPNPACSHSVKISSWFLQCSNYVSFNSFLNEQWVILSIWENMTYANADKWSRTQKLY